MVFLGVLLAGGRADVEALGLGGGWVRVFETATLGVLVTDELLLWLALGLVVTALTVAVTAEVGSAVASALVVWVKLVGAVEAVFPALAVAEEVSPDPSSSELRNHQPPASSTITTKPAMTHLALEAGWGGGRDLTARVA